MCVTPTVAQLIDRLFRNNLRDDGREYTYEEISRALHGELEPSYISKLRNGKITNPGRNTLLILCTFFRVPASYFFPELDSPVPPDSTEELSTIAVALRATQLSPAAQQKLIELIQTLQGQ